MDQGSDIAQAITELPVAGMIPVGLALIAGLLLWAAGRRILLGAFAAIGLIVGGAAGWMIGELMGLGGMQIWIPAVVGGIVFACVAALASRLVVAVAFALTLGIAAPLATMTLAQIGASSDDQPTQAQIADPGDLAGPIPDIPLPAEVAEWLDRIDPGLGNQGPPEAQPEGAPPDLPLDLPLDLASESLGDALEIPEQAQRYVDHIQHIAGQLAGALEAKWDTTPASARPTVIASALSGLLVGMLLGALVRGFSAVVVTAFSGSLLWLSCAWTLASHLGVPEGPWMPGSSTSWLGWWMGTAVIGLAIQWTLRRKRADKSAD